jgi:hypothetical protein
MQPSEVACYDPACVATGPRGLTISAIAKTQEIDGVTYQYATGVIATKSSPFTLGCYVEWQANFDGAGGLIFNHTGLWSTAPDWPAGGECDMFESWGGHATCNYHSPAGAPGVEIPGDWTGQHTVGALYGPQTADIYFDGELVAQLATGGVTAPQYLLASMQLGDTPAPVTVPAQLRISSVRVLSPAT